METTSLWDRINKVSGLLALILLVISLGFLAFTSFGSNGLITRVKENEAKRQEIEAATVKLDQDLQNKLKKVQMEIDLQYRRIELLINADALLERQSAQVKDSLKSLQDRIDSLRKELGAGNGF